MVDDPSPTFFSFFPFFHFFLDRHCEAQPEILSTAGRQYLTVPRGKTSCWSASTASRKNLKWVESFSPWVGVSFLVIDLVKLAHHLTISPLTCSGISGNDTHTLPATYDHSPALVFSGATLQTLKNTDDGGVTVWIRWSETLIIYIDTR
jgi:hypothetical protein